jgi:hypothetical protein
MWIGQGTDVAAALDQVKYELDDHVVFAPQDFCDSVGDPSTQLRCQHHHAPHKAEEQPTSS